MPMYRYGSACDYHRIINPVKYLGMPTTRNINMATLVVFNRLPGIGIDFLLELKKSIGFKMICDLDDYWELYEGHYVADNWAKYNVRGNIIRMIKEADAVTVTTDYLGQKVKEFNKNVIVIPNALPYGDDQFAGKRQPWSGKVKYIGGRTHKEDLRVAGLNYDIPQQLPIEYYMNHYKGVNICVAPLMDNEFNRCKSNLKVLEAGVNYQAIITSKIEPYLNIPGVEYADNGQWGEKISKMVGDEKYSNEKGLEIGEYVRIRYDLRKVNEVRRQLYEYMV